MSRSPDQLQGKHVKPPCSLPDVEMMSAFAVQAASRLKLLANEERLRLLRQLSRGEQCVSELEAQLNIHQPTLSQQLGVLRRGGAIKTVRHGKKIYYNVADPNLLEVSAMLYRLYGLDNPGPLMAGRQHSE